MIHIINYIGGVCTLTVALLFLEFSDYFRIKFLNVEKVILKNLNVNSKLPTLLLKAIISIEDKRYYSHLGIDFYSIFRALRNYVTKKRLEGASTLSQQLVRTILGDREISVSRKINEILISVLITNKFSKNEIIISYCQLYDFGCVIGVEKLCKLENINLNILTDSESYQVAARFKYPILTYSNYIKYLKRVREVEMKNF